MEHQVSWSIAPIILGYLASGFASAMSFILVMTGSPFEFLTPIIAVGTGIVLISGLPGFAMALVAARRLRWQSWFHFGLSGGLNALLAVLIYFGPDEFLRTLAGWHRIAGEPPLLTSYFGAGFVGGMTYWAVVRWFLIRNVARPVTV
jgi:hypothetical protein